MFRLHFNIHNAIFFQTVSSELNLEPSIQQLIVANCQRQYKYVFSFLICIECLLLDLTWLTIIEYSCHKLPRLCFNCRKQFPDLYSFMTYHWVCNQKTGRVPLVEQELLTLPEHLSFQWGSCNSICSFICMFLDRCLSFFSQSLYCMSFID